MKIQRLPNWYYKLFPCRHNLVSIEEDNTSSKTLWTECYKCGLDIFQAQKQCKHSENSQGICFWCKKRIFKFDCPHKDIVKEKDHEWCSNCGEEFWDIN